MDDDAIRVLFVCHGNICRSTMAQCVMQHMVDAAGVGDRLIIDSAGTTNEEKGNPIYPPVREKLGEVGIACLPHRARRVTCDEYREWDHVVVMDEENVQHLRRLWGAENLGKVRKLMSYVGESRDVADPWFTRDFDATYDDVSAGCCALLEELRREYLL